MKRILPLVSLAVLAACAVEPAPEEAPRGAAEALLAEGRGQRLQDEVVGVSLEVPGDWRMVPDPVLFETYGFALFDPAGPKVGGHERSPVARITLDYQARAEELDALVEELLEGYEELSPRRFEVEVGGLPGVAVGGLPGTDYYTVVFVAAEDRLYQIGLWTEERALDARAYALLGALRFERPTRSVESLGLAHVEEAMYVPPPREQLELNLEAQAERGELLAWQGGEPAPLEEPSPRATACEFGQPSSLLWQTVWDSGNKFYSGYTTTYSGTYYNLRPGDPGWSAMSGNYGSWWGQNYHVRKCVPDLLNQYYANDWPAHRNANVYSAITGTVEWTGWDSGGYYTLGNFVVVRNGAYRALMAHLTSLAPGISWGASVGMNTVIGYAGRTGGPWDEHIHSRVAYGESLTARGLPYGGSIVWPTRLRCVSCRATDGSKDGQYDLKNSAGAKFYTRFYHGRWMRG